MVFCAECGSRFEDDTSRFCAECGAPRETIEVAMPAPSPVTPIYPPSTAVTYSPPPVTPAAPIYTPPSVATVAPVNTYPTPSTPSIATSSANCSSCGTLYADATERFCGDCGQPRQFVQQATAVLDDDDEDLFGAPPSSASSIPPPTPFHPPSPMLEAQGTTPPSSSLEVPKLGNYPGAALVAAQLAGLTVKSSKPAAPAPVDVHGTGAGISILDVVTARDMDTLPIRHAISTGIDHNRSRPSHTSGAFHSTPVTPQCTVHQNVQLGPSPEEAFYASRTLPDSTEWTALLRQHRHAKTQFTDPAFPPSLASLYRDPTRPMTPPGTTALDSVVWKWKRISDLFSHHAYVEVSILDDDQKLVCGIAMKSPAEAESMLETIRGQQTQVIDARFLLRATDAVTAALHKKRTEHFLNLTRPLMESMQERVADGSITKYELLWQKSLLDAYKPLVFAGVGTPYGYRLDGYGTSVSKVQVLVPIQFQAQQVCLFDREITSGASCKPGRLADGYLFGALSMLSTSPTALSQLFPRLTGDLVQPHMVWPSPHELEQQYNDEGVYCVRFWRNHKSYLVVVDDYIPCNHNGKPAFASFTGTASRFEIWSMLVEKAYAKLYGGYDMIVGGQELFCLQDLYGGLPSSYPTSNLQANASARLSQSLKRGNLIGLTNTTNHSVAMPLGLKAGHAYGLVKIAQLQVQGQLETVVQLRNVWSDASSDAAAAGVPWARGGADWKQCSLHQKQRVGYQLADDGTVWLTLATCLALFSTVLESRNVYQFPSVDPRDVDAVPLYVHVIASGWKGVTCGGREAIHLNPQFQFTTADATDVVVHVEQPCRRANMQADYPCFVAPVVAAHAVVGRRKLDVAKDVIATGTFVSNRSCLVELSLPSEGTYAVIPATYAPFESAFQVVVVSPVPLAVGFVSDDDIPVCSVCRQPLKGSYRTYTSPYELVILVRTCASSARNGWMAM
ncbi:hypothetical protein, variant 1 [Aphanomyces astaci]|uniref:Calpain catalytic domain-containing protein n=1 Tax=Aphanomyces astaci TaxID=112090 RepID=W4FY06_APHAT|nr:hypothetical protein, variant 2 [Aphanomyces astaci]XP_009838848.1 hypothetical protein, variant 1 [Aphanomyces astaci]ETV71659.1 hypothetical protein, variant 1 [Aphanomyces astaci]ETV71660.1 hypothetical protein, variant 2 [Aphanomyces astaci]|eukprot:XP_009838846.1 hypothetical protein, variant 2 [Aphanomyces astaci]